MSEDVKVGGTSTDKSILPFQKRKQLERDLEHITEEMYKRNRELAETNKTLSLLRTIDALALESHTSVKLVCEHITEAIAQVTDYDFVGLMTRSLHDEERLELAGWSGHEWLGKNVELGFSRPIHVRLDPALFDSWLERSRLIALESVTTEQLAEFLHCTKEDIKRVKRQLPLKSVYVIKLFARRRLAGLLLVGFLNPVTEFNQTDAQMMDRLSESIGVALDNKLLFEENQSVLRQLRVSNSKLKALDEAKDDFISMASHQLRTPLTSVKGYISLVLEGDAGELSAQQSKLLTQSFASAQRMVYIIADLLNVSRLRTGKFVIDASPVNLTDVVADEIKQLETIAKTHSIKLNFKKPRHFPLLTIDETKTRQIIMNFVDNAIYYTPAGGRINVELIDKPLTVELRVSDNGIGVPKSEQPHMFSKFYRASNARHARPDGTGLGLFMAKKVIIAQGGSVIFESKEGHGSTFGFIFSKAKLAVPMKEAAETAVGKHTAQA